MKRTTTNRLFNCTVIMLIFGLIILFFVMNRMMLPMFKPETSEDTMIVYDKTADWTTIESEKFQQPVEITRELEGHFLDPCTTSCFFYAMSVCGYDVDIDEFYKFTLDAEDNPDTFYQGHLSADWMYTNSMAYITEKEYNISVEDISDKGFDYVWAAAQNKYPIIVWVNGNKYHVGEAFTVYDIKDNFATMINFNSTLSLRKDEFQKEWEYCGSRAIIYGKYW